MASRSTGALDGVFGAATMSLATDRQNFGDRPGEQIPYRCGFMKRAFGSFHRHRRSRPPLLILLGAGSSVPEIPGVGDLTTRLLGWNAFRAPRRGDGASAASRKSLGPAALAPLVERGSSDKRPTFFKALRDVIAKTYEDPDKAINFESLIYACDELAHLLPREFDRDDGFRWMLESFFQLRAKRRAWGEPRVPLMMSLISEEARYFILKCVGDASATSAPLHPVARGLRELARRFVLRTHSLNYDDLPLGAGKRFYTGFDGRSGRFRPSIRGRHTSTASCSSMDLFVGVW